GHRMQAERLDRRIEHHLVARHREARLAERLGDIARRDRAVELAALAGLTDQDDALPVELLGHRLGLLLELEIARLDLAALRLEALAVGLRGPQRLAARQQEIARKPVLDAHHIADLSELGDPLQQNDFHDGLLRYVRWICELVDLASR